MFKKPFPIINHIYFCQLTILFFVFLFSQSSLAENNSEDVQVMFLKNFGEKCGEPENIWIGGTDNLHLIKNINNGTVYKVKGIKQSHIKNALLKDGRIWINTHNGLYYVLPSNPEKAQRIDGLEDTIVVKLYFNDHGIVALDWKRKLFRVDTQSNEAFPLNHINKLSLFKITDAIPAEDPEFPKSYVWVVGREDAGLKVISKSNFDSVVSLKQFDGVTISGLQEINGYVWALTKNDGLYRITLPKNKAEGADDEKLEFFVDHLKPTKSHSISKLLKINGKFLAGTLGHGVYIFNPEDLQQVVSIPSLDGEMINLVDESKDYVWIVGDFKGDIVRIKKKDLQSVAVTSDLQSEKIIDIKPYGNYLWILTSMGTVYRIDQNNIQNVSKVTLLNGKKVTKLKLIGDSLFFESFFGAFIAAKTGQVSNVRGLENKRINAVYSKDGQYWTETYDHAIYRIDPSNPSVAHYLRELDGINIWNIIEKDGNYIIASNNGAFVIHKDNLNHASLIPRSKNHKITSLLFYCDSLLLGTLEGYQRYFLVDIF